MIETTLYVDQKGSTDLTSVAHFDAHHTNDFQVRTKPRSLEQNRSDAWFSKQWESILIINIIFARVILIARF